jgi:hypothetical protein
MNADIVTRARRCDNYSYRGIFSMCTSTKMMSSPSEVGARKIRLHISGRISRADMAARVGIAVVSACVCSVEAFAPLMLAPALSGRPLQGLAHAAVRPRSARFAGLRLRYACQCPTCPVGDPRCECALRACRACLPIFCTIPGPCTARSVRNVCLGQCAHVGSL